MERPLDLNRADVRLLYDLPGVTYKLAQDIVAYRQEHGAFASVDELSQVSGMQPNILDSITPFVTVGGAVRGGAAGETVRGTAKAGSIWRDGFDRNSGEVQSASATLEFKEIKPGPQSYLRLRGSAFSEVGFGLLATYRQRTNASWDTSQALLVTDGPRNLPDLDDVYVDWVHGSWSVILGSYDVGFGERLTLDTSKHRDPHGWYELDELSEDNESGRLRVAPGFFGGAVSLLGADLPFGWVDATAFVSSQLDDTYQYRAGIWFGVDDSSNSDGECHTDGDCPTGYVCGDDNLCRTTQLVDEDGSVRYEDVTYKDSYRETLYGGNVTLNLDENTALGVTGYQSYLDIKLAPESNSRFSPSSRFPSGTSQFGAAGAFVRKIIGPVILSSEYAMTSARGHAFFGRGIFSADWMELTAAFRHYGPWFENPHARPEAARDEDFGLAARNEQGMSLEAVVTAVPRLRSVTKVDLYRHLYGVGFDEDGDIVAMRLGSKEADEFFGRPTPDAPLSLRSRQTLQYGVTRSEDLSLTVNYDNNDLEEGGHDEFFDDETDSSLSNQTTLDDYGRGRRWKVRVGGTTRRIPRLSLFGSATQIWEDTRRFDDAFETAQKYRVRVSARPLDKTVVVLGYAAWIHDRPAGSLSDREEPRSQAFLDLKHEIIEDLTLRLRYGVLHFDDERPGSFDWYHVAKASIEGRL
jgi:hypothetical protein